MAERSLREAFAQACAGRIRLVAAEASPDMGVEAAENRWGRCLRPDGDLNPRWAELEASLRHGNPAPVLDTLCEMVGARWEPIPRPWESLRAQAVTDLAAIREALERLAETLAEAQQLEAESVERKGPIRARPKGLRRSA